MAAVFVATFGSVGVVHVMERRPVAYETPASRSGASLPARVTAQAADRLARRDPSASTDEEAVRGIAEAYRWDERVLREIARQRGESLLLDEAGERLDLESLLPGSFLDGCRDGEPVREDGEGSEDAAELPSVSAPVAVVEASRGPLVVVALVLATLGAAGAR